MEQITKEFQCYAGTLIDEKINEFMNEWKQENPHREMSIVSVSEFGKFYMGDKCSVPHVLVVFECGLINHVSVEIERNKGKRRIE